MFVLLLTCSATAQDRASIDGPVADGTPLPAVAKNPWPAVEVLEVHERNLPDRKLTMQRIKNPGLPDPTPPDPTPPTEEGLKALRESPESKEFEARQQESKIVFVSATVYDHRKTLVRWHGNGTPTKSFAAWSNIDFNHFSSIGAFESGGICYSYMMGVGNQDTVRLRARSEQEGWEYEEPQAPDLPMNEPGFVLIEGDPNDAVGMAPMRGLHELYKTEASRLAAAYEERERVRLETEAYLKANPPAPEDIVINYWKVQPQRRIGARKGGEK